MLTRLFIIMVIAPNSTGPLCLHHFYGAHEWRIVDKAANPIVANPTGED